VKPGKIVFLLLVASVLVGLVVWRVAFHIPTPGQTDEIQDVKAVEGQKESESGESEEAAVKSEAPKDGETSPGATETEKKKEKVEEEGKEKEKGETAEKTPEAEKASEAEKSEQADQTKESAKESPDDKDSTKADDPNKPAEPEEELEAVNLKDVEMKEIIPRLSNWTGKVIIPHPDAAKEKLTIYSDKKLPRAQAMARIYDALRFKGFVAEESDSVIFIKPIKDAKLGQVPTIPADEPLALIENKNQIVQKFFRLKNYNPGQLQQIIQPLIPEHGAVFADESTSQLVVIDTVDNLLRIERIINQLDVTEAEETVTKTFQISDGDPVEIVQLLQLLLADKQVGSRAATKGMRSDSSGPDKSGESATSVVIGPSQSPIILIPVPKRKWIIAKASANDMVQIVDWIEKLDEKKTAEREYSLMEIEYAEVRELTDQINKMLEKAPGQLKANVMVQPLIKGRKIMIIGSAENREMVEKLIADVDKPGLKFTTKNIKLTHIDPEIVKQNIDDLYAPTTYISSSSYGREYSSRYTSSQSRGIDDPDLVKVYAFPTLKQVTVMCSDENMIAIEKQIAEWDKPIDVDEVKPMIIGLKNSDPVQMAKLLSKLFSEESSSGSSRYYFYDFFNSGGQDEKKKIIGPLYGQLTFEAVPETKKIIVISKIPEAYEVIEELILELDQQETAELPMVVVLKYADCEELCDQLNAILNEAGTTAVMLRRERGLDDTGTNEEEASRNPSGSRYGSGDGSGDGDRSRPGELRFWWNSPTARSTITNRSGQSVAMPISNIIGKIRFIPVHRSKAILVLSPREYQESIQQMIDQLDQPAKQVMIKAVIVEVNYEDLTSLGVQLSSNQAALGTINEDAIKTLTEMVYAEAPSPAFTTLQTTLNVHALVDLLVKETNGRVLHQPTIFTKDNEQTRFFKGDVVPFLKGSQVSPEGGSLTTTVDYREVGLTLYVRPNITPENNVDTTITLEIAQVKPGLVNGNIATSKFDTSTHLIVENGQTILISGILYQNDTNIERKVPLLGDIPLLGELFKHYDVIHGNSELLAFITPYVIDDEDPKVSEAAMEELETSVEKMENVTEELNEIFNDEEYED